MPITRNFLIICVLVALVLPRIPLVGKFFNIINTALHEFGHALVALIMGGEVCKIELFKDTSGTTVTRSSNNFAASLVSLAGYPFAVSVAWFAFYLIGQNAAQGLVIGLSVLFLIMLLFWIRNIYGALWVLLFCAVNGYLIYRAEPVWISRAAVFYAVMVLTESVSSAVTIFVLSVRDGGKAGDATNLAKTTRIPAFVWGLLFMAYTCWVAYRVVLMVLPAL